MKRIFKPQECVFEENKVYNINVDKVNKLLEYYIAEGFTVSETIKIISKAVKEGTLK